MPLRLMDRWREAWISKGLDGAAGAEFEARQRQGMLRVLRADGQRVDLTARDAGTRLLLTRQDWQADAWTYRDMIGELRYAQRLLARSVAQVRFFAAEIREYPDDPVELNGDEHSLDPALAADAVANLARLPLDEGPDGFVSTLTENIETAGECWIHGQPDEGNGELWTVRSVSEVIGQGDQILLAELPTQSTLGQRRIDPFEEELLRCWVRHPRWGQLADSPLRSMLDVLEEVVLTGREMRAAARSRIASNGILMIPNSLTLLRARDEMEDLLELDADEDFMADFTEALTAPIRNEGSPGAVVPLVLRGDPEALKEVRHLSLTRDDASKLMERLSGALLRMLQGLDIQPEQVQGMGNVNHWTGWQIEASAVRHQVLPTAGVVAGCLAKAFLRPALIALGHDPDQVRRVGVWYDPMNLVESPDRRQDARDAWDREGISNAAMREALGFSEDDAPEADEYLIRLLSRGRLTPQAVPLVAALSGLDFQDRRLQDALAISMGLQTRSATRELPTAAGNGQPTDGATSPNKPGPNQVVPEQTTPTPPATDTPAPPPESGVTAAAPAPAASGAPEGWRVDPDLTRALADIDATLMERMLVAADAAILRALERAGGRARNAVRNKHKDAALANLLEGADTLLVPHLVGAERLAEFVTIPELLAGAYQRLKDQFGEWMRDAYTAVAAQVVRLLGYSGRPAARVREQVIERLQVNQAAAWDEFSRALDKAAQRAMFRDDPLNVPAPERGEYSKNLITPSEIRAVLTVAGGGRPEWSTYGAFAAGPTVMGVVGEQGGVTLGWEWQYRHQVPRGAHFPPHMALDGTRFSTWTDPKLDTSAHTDWLGEFFHPQDHPGCRCTASPVVAVVDSDPDDIVGQRIRAAAASTQGQMAAQIAAEDTAAGRVGTSLQQEVEIRDRILADLDRMKSQYITSRS